MNWSEMQSPASAVGAGAFHIHRRDSEGHERLNAEVVNSVVERVRDACKLLVGVTTWEWMEPDVEPPAELVREWCAPDYTTVNLRSQGQWRSCGL
jgi:uncharacterized protein (DUF849 family)